MSNNTDTLYTQGEDMQFNSVVRWHVVNAANAPVLLLQATVGSFGVAFLGYLEWEILYRVFGFLSGDRNAYWSPALMGCTSAGMIVGFHLLAKTHPQHVAVRFVNAVAHLLIPVYLLGTGLLIAAILYAGGLAEMIQTAAPLVLGELPSDAPVQASWLETLFSSFANPAAVAVFSAGIGGFSIVNVAVVHRLLEMITAQVSSALHRLSKARAAVADYAVIRQCQKRYAELGQQLDTLDTWTDERLRTVIANATLAAIADALMQHKRYLMERALKAVGRFDVKASGDIDPWKIEAAVARIEAISFQDIRAALKP